MGDALGVPVEFQSRAARRSDPVTHMRAFGTHNQPAGTWSDDASLTFCLAETIADGFTLGKLAQNCCRWYFENFWTPHGRVFDIGVTTREALQRIKQKPGLVRAGGTDEYCNGNGSLMRILPLAFYQPTAPLAQRFQLIYDVSAVTHGHVRSAVACFLYLEMAGYLLAGHPPEQAYELLCQKAPAQLAELNIPAGELPHFERILSGRLPTLSEKAIDSGGYVMHTLEAAFWCLLRYNTFAATVLAAVNLGDDTDTTGAVAGGLAGLYYGEAAIPVEWRQVLVRRPDIEDLAWRMQTATITSAASVASPPPRPLPNSYWATPSVLGCEYPGDLSYDVARAKLTALLDAGITDFFDLTELRDKMKPYEQLLQKLAAERGLTARYHRFGIRDVQVPTPEVLESVLAELAATVAAGRKAVVHCWGGVGRTGTIIGCYLVRHHQLTGEQALQHIMQEWQGVAKIHLKPNSPETEAQCELVKNFR
ncbi:ADP-ribosylglycohydrolase family protein [Hymenobacter translucens]|uniref:ADP-ribosylglycohydrolase family protein n=1 Tax=Hymenobacter translucens TaxID=2886507 RepID=UPI00293F3062|nr:ADP-ribosylglycohydrolase family protein [Hymenobacter translucens]